MIGQICINFFDDLCIVSSIKNVPGPLKVEPPIVINELGGGYTEEVQGLLESFL